MSLFSHLLAMSIVGLLVAWVLFVLLGQVTVRKLRNNPAVKNHLGLELISGYDIFNVASALSAPEWFRKKYKKSPLSFFAADYEILFENTTLFDRILARVFWFSFVLSGGFMISLVVLEAFGIFD